MKYELDLKELSLRLKTKRLIELNIGLRDVAKKSKVSAATICRIENGRMPDMGSFIKISNWLQTSPSVFFKIKSTKK